MLFATETPPIPGLQELWAETQGDPRIRIAVLDGAVDASLSCFEGGRLTRLETLVCAGPSEHGTHIASLIFGQHTQASPVFGIAPGCHGLIAPVFEEAGNGSLAPCSQLDLGRVIRQCVGEGAHVINISGGQLTPPGGAEPWLAEAVRLCAENGILIVAAAGNEGCECLHVPAALPSVLAVGATDSRGSPLELSNWGYTRLGNGVLAPGQGIVGAVPGGGTAARSGTSFATPIVTGVVALLLSLQLREGRKPDPRLVREAILRSAHPCNPRQHGDCRRFLAGVLNIRGARGLLVERARNEVIISSEYPMEGGIREMAEEEILNVSTNGEQKGGESGPSAADAVISPPMPQDGPVPAAGPAVPASTSAGVSPAGAVAAGESERSPAPLPSGEVVPAGCDCGGGGEKPCTCGRGGTSLVYAIGELGFDFGTEARRDSIAQSLGGPEVHDPGSLLRHLEANPWEASALIWTLNLDATPVYAIRPAGAYASVAYERLREFLNGQLNEGVERISVPGIVAGQARLYTGQVVPVIQPELRGMFSWSTPVLVKAVVGEAPKAAADRREFDRKSSSVENFLNRIYFEIRNLGLSPQERAMNFAATNAFQVGRVFQAAAGEETELDSIDVEKSPICRPDSDCWDVKLVFFDPKKRFERARKIYRFTVDVSDVVPVTVGEVRSWFVF